MNINRAAIKNNARAAIKGTSPSPILVGLVFLGIMALLRFLDASVSGYWAYLNEGLTEIMAGNYQHLPLLPHISLPAQLITLAISVVSLTISTGFTIFCMHAAQGKKVCFGNLFDGFTIFFKLIIVSLVMGIFIWLWSLLFIIPGIIAAYRYRMTIYVLLDNPQMGALECINESKRLMDGRKGELFVLDLSFLGWQLLTVVPFVSVWVTPYTTMTYVNYYLALRDLDKTTRDDYTGRM